VIADPQFKIDVRAKWLALRSLCSGSHRQAALMGGMVINETPPENYYNLPLVLAYAVLDEVLSQLISENRFSCSGRFPPLGAKMVASKTALPWQDYDLVETGKVARNKLAHEAAVLSRADCLRFIGAIERELIAWHLIQPSA
jgi:hypothetical protein